ncbi:hypothetical protein PYW08_004381 [Mythimna loreyi]|uniref:Uncharacterized protein n=1 Tax=Mythimna loreyi TaxID=667449 RepID=A0ACC2QP32_9NEOP|nr:hypothetical protein PYW08_004381 [Mythimna loreyi]
MEGVKKWLTERNAKKNGMYVHYSPPKMVGVVSAAQLRQWARGGAESRLERAVLAGHGRRLLAETEGLPLSNHLTTLVTKCDALHAAVEKGSLLELQELLESDYNRRKFVMCRDEAGVGLLHKAVFYDYMDIAEYLVKNYPEMVHQKDSEGRTPLHYSATSRDSAALSALLEGAGAARGARDAAGHTPAHYRGQARELLALPDVMARDNKNAGLVIKRHNIRIWCHDCDMARLQRVVWEGHGSRLLSEVSSQPVVKKFLEAVPYIMNTIRDIHTAVVQNDLEGLMKHAGDPVPPQALSSRDANNMTVMHKAAGLGHGGILKYIAERYPQGINDVDNDGRTPLHYAAAMRDDQHTYNTLVGLGADESVVDNKNKTPAYYINRPQEIDKNMFKTLPDAPRTPSSAYPNSWDWKLLDTEVIAELNKKSRRRNHKASNENISSKDTNTMTASDSTDNRIGGMKGSSTHELINNLPELDDAKQTKDDIENHIANVESNKESEVVEENHEEEEINEGTAEEAAEEHEEKTDDGEQHEEKNDDAEEHEEKTDDTEKHEENIDDAEEAVEHVEETKEEKEHLEHSHEETTDHVEEADENKEESAENDEEPLENVDETASEAHQEADNDQNNPEEEKAETEVEKDDDHTHEHDTEGEREHTIEEKEENKDLPEESNEEKTKEEIESHETHHENENHTGETGEHETHHTEENNTNENETNHDNDSIDGAEDDGAASNEGNAKNGEHSEDDDDVQVPGETQSEYSDSNLKSTAELSDRGSAKRGNVTNGRSTQESLIEGVVNGEAELDSQDASMTQREGSVHGEVLVVDNEIDPEVTDLINNANMEMLATLVLNGEGSRLIGRHSRNSELQAFLDNVPTYMQKINKVHIAAREGNIRDLQAALDRRKFAIARDPISPNGATPLHVATIFGKTNIIKYLGGRFPETLSAVDFEGRTALHYAAVLPDNGHYYNLLQQLGANSKDLDDNGKSAEEYQHQPNLLPFDQLLSDYGISEDTAKSMFSDKGTSHADNGHMDIPMFRTEEGRYLAKSLGDPLIKGLTEVANIKPKDPVAFLASFLHNFPEQEKSNLGTQETEMIVTQEAAEVENDQAPRVAAGLSSVPLERTRTATKQRPIDIVTVDPQPATSPDAPESAFSSATRDEHGQSMLHFAAARTHARNALFQLLQESDISLGFRDELYRTARDVSIQANVPENTVEIDKWVLHMAARGNTDKIMELLMEGYDHILDVVDEEGVPITEVIAQRGDSEMSNLLASIPAFEESRESLHGAVRRGDLPAVQAALSGEGARTLARCQNSFGRTALHVAVLAQHEDVVAYLAQNYPELLRLGDNLERTPLHYAMGVEKIESLSRVLIRAGAKRVLKDLKGRQPTYYFMNKSEILRLKEEEDVY